MVRKLLLEIETLTQIRYSNKYGHLLTDIGNQSVRPWRVWRL